METELKEINNGVKKANQQVNNLKVILKSCIVLFIVFGFLLILLSAFILWVRWLWHL